MLEKGAIESVKQVVSRVLKFAVCHPQEEWKTSLGNQPAVIESSPSEGEVSHGDARKSLLSIQKGDWVVSVDLTDAYLHVPIHPSSRKFLRFLYQEVVFQFWVLPFGLLVSPRNFTRVVDAMMAHVRSLGLQVHHYLDDGLLRNQQVEYLRSQTECLLFLAARLG